MLFQIPKSTAHKRAEKIFGTGSLLNPLNWPKAAFSYFLVPQLVKLCCLRRFYPQIKAFYMIR